MGAREAFNFAPSHGLLVIVGVVGDDMEVNSVHISSSGDGALVGFAIEGLQDLGADGCVGAFFEERAIGNVGGCKWDV